ncbi:MAG: InlB B-repeat-containing protein [Clostridia bacterium]|nr:InlB B-repeat-containing protein [Clostridia bacterium]
MKKFISIITAVFMLASILTVAVFAGYPSPGNNYTVTVSSNNTAYGTASANPLSVPQGETTTLTATPENGYRFAGWTLSSGTVDGVYDASSATIIVKPTSDVSFVANFEAIPAVTYNVTVSVDGVGGTASANPAAVEEGEASTVSAVAENGYEFDTWVVVSGSFDYGTGNITSATIVIEPHSDVVLKAKFKVATPPVTDHYDVTAEAETGGDVSVNPASVPVGEITTITATPGEGYKFNGWTADGEFEWVDGDANKPVIVVRPLSDVKFTAHFVKDEGSEPGPVSPETGYETRAVSFVIVSALVISAAAAVYTGKKHFGDK